MTLFLPENISEQNKKNPPINMSGLKFINITVQKIALRWILERVLTIKVY